MPNNYSTSIHIVLKDLIEAKSIRDKTRFTGYQLASALSMPRSIITKLTHSDASKRIINPKIETLIKIVEFFREDGFDITIDDLLSVNNKPVDVQSLQSTLSNQPLTIALYSLKNAENKLGTVVITLSQSHKNIMALYSEEDMSSFFKSGSIFIIDLDMIPVHDTLIAVRLGSLGGYQIKKYICKRNKIILKSLNDKDNDITLMPTQTCKIAGVVVQVNAKT